MIDDDDDAAWPHGLMALLIINVMMQNACSSPMMNMHMHPHILHHHVNPEM